MNKNIKLENILYMYIYIIYNYLILFNS